jgi:7-cyano-7-deazaguanine reductase
MACVMTDTVTPLHLGQTSTLPASPEEAVLDYVPNPRPGALYMARFAVPEFTSLCPVTGQPDFAHLVIDYAPGQTIVESKSLKLFLGSFRNHAGFHEDVTVGIGQRLFDEMQPRWLRIGGYWYPRGRCPMGCGSRIRAWLAIAAADDRNQPIDIAIVLIKRKADPQHIIAQVGDHALAV